MCVHIFKIKISDIDLNKNTLLIAKVKLIVLSSILSNNTESAIQRKYNERNTQ